MPNIIKLATIEEEVPGSKIPRRLRAKKTVGNFETPKRATK